MNEVVKSQATNRLASFHFIQVKLSSSFFKKQGLLLHTLIYTGPLYRDLTTTWHNTDLILNGVQFILLV